MNEEKSVAYKKLVADMQKKYPAHGSNFKSKLPGMKSIADDKAKKIASDFCKSFNDVEEFYKLLEEWGIDWQKNNEPRTKRMWAINALANALADGFEFKRVVDKSLHSSVPLWAPVVNGKNICQEINLYTYWQGFGYAEKTPKIKYLLVAQDWGNLFRRDEEENADFFKMNETGKWISPYSAIPKENGTDTNLIKLFAVLKCDLLKFNEDIFFTNFCLGYRSGNEVGGMTKKILMNDSEEFKRLCEILEPENILCLGRITFEAVFETLMGMKINNMINYADFVEKNIFFPVKCGGVDSKIFPLAHCGVIGTLNKDFEKQLENWKRILKVSEQVTKVEEQPKIKRTALYGAILGDIIGSPFEFREIRQKSKDFELFNEKSKFTDDTVMTIAIADAILKSGKEDDGRIWIKNIKNSMLHYGKKYPHAGYGGGFRKWLKSENPKPYNSFGNGSAMRVSAAGWVFNSLFYTRECARMTARPTHNHFEGVKGAMAVASAIFLARKSSSKEEIKNYIEREFDYDLSRKLDDIRPNYKFDETCQGSVPEAIIAFLESENFEDAVRNAISLGGDTDTQAAIAGSIAEAFYGVPENLIKKCREYLPQEFLDVIDKFNFGKGYLTDDLENDVLEEKIADFNKNPSEKNFHSVKEEIFDMLKKSYKFDNEIIGFFSVLEIKTNAEGNEENCPLYFDKNEKYYEVLYTNFDEMVNNKNIGENFSIGMTEMKEMFRIFHEVFFDDKNYGWAINPYGKNPFFIDRDDLKEILLAFDYHIKKEIQKNVNYPDKFTKKFLSNDLLTKKFFEDARFIHTSASGAMGDAGVFEVWNKKFEHYNCHWTDGFDVEKFHAAFMKDEDTPYFDEPVKNGWCFHYMSCGHNFYIKEEFNEEYLKKLDDYQNNTAGYKFTEEIFPVEEIMLDILAESKSEEDQMKDMIIGMESGINKFNLHDDTVVYCRADISLLDYFEKILKSDGIIYDAAFITATMFEIGSTEKELEIRIIMPKGKGHGAYIAPMSIFPEECEFVFNRGTFFKVRKVDRENPQVVLEAVGRSPKELD